MSNLLLDEKPLIIMPSLAVKVGLQESIFLQQLHYWLEKSKNVADGHKWVYNTVKEWQEQFPFWSESTIRRIIEKLEKNEFIFIDNFNKLPMDQTKWYRINYEKLEEFDEKNTILRNEKTSGQPEQMECSKRTNGIGQSEQMRCSIRTNGISQSDQTNTIDYLPEITTDIKDDDNACAKENPFSFFEENGFGVIGGFLHEKISAWCEDLSDELVLEAMKLAVENGVKTWKYVEAILRGWIDKKITTIEKARADQRAFKEQQFRRRTQSRSRGKPIRQEVIPEWYNDNNQEIHNSNATTDLDINFEEEKKRLEERLKKYRE